MLALVTTAPAALHAQYQQSEPEQATGRVTKQVAYAKRQMVVAAHPLASEAGLAMLRAGGSALDAAIAVQMVLGLVEPQSSGIGGGAFILHWDSATKALTTYDGRETAPAAAREDRFLLPDGKLRPFDQAISSGLSVGVPGVVRALELAHRKHGKLPWAVLFEPAIALAENGFLVTPRLHGLLRETGPQFFETTARAYFFDPAGKPHPVGHRLRNPELATTLRAIQSAGAKALHTGPIADAIVAKVATAPHAPGDITRADLEGYAAKERAPVCVPYRRFEVCGMGPPSSGALTVGMVLRLIEPLPVGVHALNRTGLHVVVEAEKLAFADRNRYVADTDFVAMPAGLLDPAYIAGRRKLIDLKRGMIRAAPGTPPQKSGAYGADATREAAGTSHVSIIDAAGNAVSMTTTVESVFGSRLMVGGFLLNNQLTDFSMRPRDAQGVPIANRVEAGKRPRSSMAPTVVLDRDTRKVVAVIGSPGGSRIILYVVKALVGMIDWGLDAQQAAALINFGSQNGPFEVEPGLTGSWLSFMMWWQSQTIKSTSMTSGLHIIRVTDKGLEGGADPRREGVALGD